MRRSVRTLLLKSLRCIVLHIDNVAVLGFAANMSGAAEHASRKEDARTISGCLVGTGDENDDPLMCSTVAPIVKCIA